MTGYLPTRRQMLTLGGTLVACGVGGSEIFSVGLQGAGQKPKPKDRDEQMEDAITQDVVRISKDIEKRGFNPDEHMPQLLASMRLTAIHSRVAGRDDHVRKAVKAYLKKNGREALLEAATSSDLQEHRKHHLAGLGADLDALPTSQPLPPTRKHHEQALDMLLNGNFLSDGMDILVSDINNVESKRRKSARKVEAPHISPAVYSPQIRPVQDDPTTMCGAINMVYQMYAAMVNIICVLAALQPELLPLCALIALQVAVLWIWVQLCSWWT